MKTLLICLMVLLSWSAPASGGQFGDEQILFVGVPVKAQFVARLNPEPGEIVAPSEYAVTFKNVRVVFGSLKGKSIKLSLVADSAAYFVAGDEIYVLLDRRGGTTSVVHWGHPIYSVCLPSRLIDSAASARFSRQPNERGERCTSLYDTGKSRR